MKKTMTVISVLVLLAAFVFTALPVSAASHQAAPAKMEMDKPAMMGMMKEMMMSPEMKTMMMGMMKEMMMAPEMKDMMAGMMKEMMMAPEMKDMMAGMMKEMMMAPEMKDMMAGMMKEMMSQHNGQQHGAEQTQQQHDSGGKH